MQEMIIDFKKSIFIINNEQYNLFDLPLLFTSTINSLEKELPALTEIEKGRFINQLSITKIQTQEMILAIKNYWESLGISLN